MMSNIPSTLLSTCLNTYDTHMGDWPMWGGWWFMWPIVWVAVFLVIGIFVYKDAEKRDMNGLLWFILVILPMVGILFLIIYLVFREEHVKDMKFDSSKSAEKMLDERYARGEVTKEEYRDMKKEMKK